MKRNLILTCLTLALSVALVSCGNKTSSVDPTATPSASAPAVVPSKAPTPSKTPAPSASATPSKAPAASPEASNGPMARGFDRAMDDMGDALDDVGDMARGAVGNGTVAPGWEPQSAGR